MIDAIWPARWRGKRGGPNMVCRQCKGQVPSDHQGSGCPICGKETVFDLAVQPALTKSEHKTT